MPFYSGRSLQDGWARPAPPAELFKLFADICDGVAHIHTKGVVHRDLKPANVFLDGCRAVVGDLGLGFRFGAESLTESMEVATARWFGAPELRNGHLERPLPSVDVYSLGKLLYWLFTRRVYDRDEQDYEVEDRKLSQVLGKVGIDTSAGIIDDRLIHAGAFADDIVSLTVRYQPSDRVQTAGELALAVRRLIARFECGGRALDLRLPQRCLFCGNGEYRPVAAPPNVELRTAPPDQDVLAAYRPGVWAEMRSQTNSAIGQAFAGGGGNLPVPLNLICNYCGNMQHFRWNRGPQAQKLWKP
jgi:serine/threonine protein kinase